MNKLKCYFTLGWESLSSTDTLAYSAYKLQRKQNVLNGPNKLECYITLV